MDYPNYNEIIQHYNYPFKRRIKTQESRREYVSAAVTVERPQKSKNEAVILERIDRFLVTPAREIIEWKQKNGPETIWHVLCNAPSATVVLGDFVF